MHPPSPSEVVLNLVSLYGDLDFQSAVSDFTERYPEHAKALNAIGNRQHEVILVAPLRATQIVALSGQANDFDGVLIKFGATDSAKRNQLYQDCINRSFYPQEAFYMSAQGSQHAVCEVRHIMLQAAKQRTGE